MKKDIKIIRKRFEDGLVFVKDGDKFGNARNCGHIVIGKSKAPEVYLSL